MMMSSATGLVRKMADEQDVLAKLADRIHSAVGEVIAPLYLHDGCIFIFCYNFE